MMKTLTLVMALIATPLVAMTAVGDDATPLTGSMEPPPWTLYSQTYGGRIGIVHGLTKNECETRQKQALGIPATQEEKAAYQMFEEHHRCKPDPEMPHLCNGLVSVLPDGPAYAIQSSDVRYAECRNKPLP